MYDNKKKLSESRRNKIYFSLVLHVHSLKTAPLKVSYISLNKYSESRFLSGQLGEHKCKCLHE